MGEIIVSLWVGLIGFWLGRCTAPKPETSPQHLIGVTVDKMAALVLRDRKYAGDCPTITRKTTLTIKDGSEMSLLLESAPTTKGTQEHG